ncbi:MAG TPA: hypothetical protein VFL82_04865, partial [Thermomicrobiales bacterium]|nr:hypothetical protein [Thermomicrobiales bacterium]
MQQTTQQSLANDQLRLTIDDDGSGYTLDVRDGDDWRRAGRGMFGKLVIQNASEERQETEVRPTDVSAADDHLTLTGEWTDADGLTWTFSEHFNLTDDSRQIQVVAQATPSGDAKVLHFTGPTILAGEGSFGGKKTDAIFPGLEYLGENEPSSSTAFASSKYAGRTVPHPYKIGIPMMAISHDGLAVGLMWDPHQDYGSAWRHPAAVFSSPNQLEGGDN